MLIASRYTLFSIVALVLITVFGLRTCERETSWRQRLTIIVETPDGEVRGSSVTEVVKTETKGAWVVPEARGVRSNVTGEAGAVEIAPGRWLFALLEGSDDWQRDATHWVYPAYKLSDAASDAGAMNIVKSQPLDVPVPLPPEGWPMMVTFADINDPASVERVDPNDLAASFGEGVRVKAATLEITEADVTSGRVEQILEWWLEMRAAPYNEMIQLKLPDGSPRGWEGLSPLQFWSPDQVLEFNRRT